MKAIHKTGLAGIFLVIMITGIFWLKPGTSLKEGMIIATSVAVGVDLRNDDLGTDDRYIPGSSIIAIPLDGKSSSEPVVLTEEFYSARSPHVSYAGNLMVFSGQKKEGDVWQIFIMNLHALDTRQVTQCPVNCTDPTWLPDGRILFSRLNDELPSGPIHVLYACEIDGSNMERLMYQPNSAISSSVFQDGRIMTNSRQQFPDPGKRHLMAMRIDGTKSELFYGGDHSAVPAGSAWEASNGQVYFVERTRNGMDNGRLACVIKGHPMSSYKMLSGDLPLDFHSLYPCSNGNLLVSCRETTGQPFGLNIFDINSHVLNGRVYLNERFHIIEPVVLEARPVPLKLPVSVDKTKEKGTLLCLDADKSMDPVKTDNTEDEKTTMVQVIGLGGMLGEIPVEEDGSFYIEIDADTPLRFQTLNSKGEILRGPSSWVYVRPNEKRSCIGCHEDPELAPENKVPEALYAGMVSLPGGERTEAIVLNEKHNKK